MNGSLHEVVVLDGNVGSQDEIGGEISSPKTLNGSMSIPKIVERFTDRIRVDTTTGWESLPGYISEKGVVYVYTDHMVNEKGEDVPGFKVGDGLAYLSDLPFADDPFVAHINDRDIHVTLAEKQFWNNKVRAYLEDNTENIVFTTN